MNLAQERKYVADILNALDEGVAAYTYVPQRTTLPAWLVTPADPFISKGSTVGTATLRLDCTYVSSIGSNDVMQDELDLSVSEAVTALLVDEANIGLVGGTSPFSVQMNGTPYLAQSITIEMQIDL